MHLQQHAAACRRRSGRMPRLATPGSGASARPCTRTTKMPLAAGFQWREAQVRAVVGKPSSRPELAAVHHVAADAVGPAEQRGGARHVAGAPAPRAPPSWRRAGRAPRSSSCAPRRSLAGCRPRRASRSRRRAWRRSGSRRRPARSARRGPRTSTLSMKACGDWRRQARIEAQHHALVDAAARELGQLVAQRGDARRRQLGLAGAARRSSRADAARRSARSAAGRGAAPR